MRTSEERARLRDAFDRVADEYDRYTQNPIHARLYQAVLRQVDARVVPGAPVVDVGAGAGHYCLALAAQGYRMTAVDLAPNMLKTLQTQAQRRKLDIASVCHDIMQGSPAIPTQDAALLIYGPASYTADPRRVLSHVSAVLRPGGWVFLGVPRSAAMPFRPHQLGRVVLPWVRRRPYRIRGRLGEAALDVYLWDPHRLADYLSRWLTVDSIEACTLCPWLPASVDARLGRLPGMRALGASSLLVGQIR